MSSPFLLIPESEWVASNTLAFAIRDASPASPGHTLVIPRRPVATWFDATAEEQRALFSLVDEVKRGLDAELKPDGYNLGVNVGAAAGQTVFHLHVHVIPRFQGDVADARGGIRHVIPGKGNYLATQAKPLATGGMEDPFLHHLEPLFSRALDIAVLAAFVQDSGLEVLRQSVDAALARGARVRILTGDYLTITQAEALRRLLDWMDEDSVLQGGARGHFEARVVEVEKARVSSFHPKSWRFKGPGLAVAYVGSSNISRSALKTGIEWNLRVEQDRDPRAWREVVDAFEVWWERAAPLEADWVEQYARRARITERVVATVEQEPALPPRQPHLLQQEALRALRSSRGEGRRRALVVLATGLGKTWLAALDVAAFGEERAAQPRVLFLAHREELLVQAAETFRRQFPSLRFGWYVGAKSSLAGELVFASVQKLSNPDGLQALREAAPFDYVIVDEVHHAAAASYRAILSRLDPAFLLGLTATPERADEGDVLGLFDDHLAYRADLGEGIQQGLLTPFAYFGLKDDIPYENIPWRSRSFDPEALTLAVQTEARMKTLWRAWEEHAASRTLVFCVSVSHANYVQQWLSTQGVRVAAVYSGPGSADRAQALRELGNGTLDAVCAVDLFNEGVDVPSIDRVVMLRPTESSVVFLQQLGRGLRKHDGKQRVTVIDFVGNHRMFLDRVRTLLALGRSSISLRDFLVHGKQPELPPGCSVQVSLEAKKLLQHFLAPGETDAARAYRELRTLRGQRPTIGELYRSGHSPASLLKRDEYAGWFHFVGAERDLTEAQARALKQESGWFRNLELTPMSKCFEMVLLEALLEAEALWGGLSLPELAHRSLSILQRSPELLQDLEGVTALDDPREPSTSKFLAFWKTEPVREWTKDGKWFRIEGDRLVPRFTVSEDTREAFEEMTRELVEYRLAQYRRRRLIQGQVPGTAFEAQIISNGRHPILKLPDRQQRPDLPSGLTDIRLPDGTLWRFNFVKIAVNVAKSVDAAENQLAVLLTQWFGDRAGKPGTAFRVRFTPRTEGWSVEPVNAAVIAFMRPVRLVAFPTLRAAAGAASHALSLEEAPDAEHVRLPIQAQGDGLFVVRASGDSMNGGERPIRNGDWLVMRYSRDLSLQEMEGKVALIQVPDAAGYAYQVKRLVKDKGHWALRSDNPNHATSEAGADMVPIALLVEVVPPERVGPERGAQLTDEQLMARFGLTKVPKTGRHEGHLFLFATGESAFTEPGVLASRIAERRPGETAFVFTREAPEAPWHYQGSAHWDEQTDRWTLAD
ncbi:DEAD/DEAH box helicase family protein [Myxococcus qinghaiensis]|uniref:DEAD/DEAH box helicase family protein n=1 Tax=Myxococcus qinghaiensis TaxID=2906758 RepID=UPI0020A75F05|nr:DEAD/DEAH box helicase family protein [Myxococcus qinghaiensis]MCP3168761.1 DEAD/DEAH box helicase family protein [Myxococcus qinghaiensis]